MYRLLAAQGEVRERRNQLMHPHYQRPELLASPYKKPEHWIVRGSLQMTNEKCQMTNGKYQFLRLNHTGRRGSEFRRDKLVDFLFNQLTIHNPRLFHEHFASGAHFGRLEKDVPW